MSQSTGLLNDEEVRAHLNELLTLNLNRDALTKPTRELLIDIYSKFLDATEFTWRHGGTDQLPIEAYIVPMMNKILEFYDPPHKFSMMDFICPNRKRTNYYLNMIIYVMAQFNQYSELESNYIEERSKKQVHDSQLEKNIQSKRQYLEESASKMAALPSKDKLIKEIEEERKNLNGLEISTEELKKKGETLKAGIRQIQTEIDLHKKNIDELKEKEKCLRDTKLKIEDTKKLADQIPELEELIKRKQEEFEQKITDIKLETSDTLARIRSENRQKIDELQRELLELRDPLLQETQYKKERAARLNRINDINNQIRDSKETKVKLCEAVDQLSRDAGLKLKQLQQKDAKMASLLDKFSNLGPQLDETGDIPADRTYIKKSV